MKEEIDMNFFAFSVTPQTIDTVKGSGKAYNLQS